MYTLYSDCSLRGFAPAATAAYVATGSRHGSRLRYSSAIGPVDYGDRVRIHVLSNTVYSRIPVGTAARADRR